MPSNKILEEKKAKVAELAESIKNAASCVLVNYQGITVEDDTKMRKELREAGVQYVVVKNTMTGRAFEMNGTSDMQPYLNGMTALAIGTDDAVAPAKVLKKYADKLESFSILAGYLDGAVIDEKAVAALADIPSKETLIAKFLGSIRSPLFGLAYALQAVVDKGDSAAADEAAPAEEAPAAEAAPAAEEAAPAEA